MEKIKCETCIHELNELGDFPCNQCNDESHWENKFNDVNKPAHYADRGIEVIDFIVDANRHGKYIGTEPYFVGNVLKYITRFRLKGTPMKDLLKAKYYLEALIQEAERNGAE